MTKATLLRRLEEVANKLAELRAAAEQLPNAEEERLSAARDTPTNELDAAARIGTIRFVNKQKLQSIVDRTFTEMGIRGEPIGAEKVQELIAACGVKPEENMLSRGIIEMREE